MMKRFLSFLLGAALIVVLAVPVSAEQGNIGGWIELLEYSSVQLHNENWFEISGTSGSFTIPIYSEKRLRKIDALIWHQTADYPTTASVGNFPLTVIRVENNLSRICGTIPTAYYENLTVNLSKPTSGNAVWELLSCKVTPVSSSDYVADAHFSLLEVGDKIDSPGSGSWPGNGLQGTYAVQFSVQVDDWQKYDSITIIGSVRDMGLNSVRASVDQIGLPYTMTYTNTNASASYDEYYLWNEMQYYEYDETDKGSTTGTVISALEYCGKVLYNLTIDLSGVDRTIKKPLMVYFTGVAYGENGYNVQLVGVTGSVNTADTSSVTWWNRFTGFMNNLFGSKGSEAVDDLGSSSDSISQNASQIHDFEQSQQAVLDNNFAQIQGVISFTNFAAALVFVQKYTNMTFNGISKYAIVFTLPLFLGLFFYLCSRIPGITRWKTPPPRSPSPKSKGGGKT